MTEKVAKAVRRLNEILPIKAQLDELDKHSADIYQSVVSYFYQHGKAPMLSELVDEFFDARQIVTALGAKDMLTLYESGEVKGCYPFTMEQRVHRIHINGIEAHTMCALDALAPSGMFGCKSTVMSQCAVSGTALRIELDDQTLLNPTAAEGIYFGLNWMAASACGSCADNLCTEMHFLRNGEIALNWWQRDQANLEIFTLVEAIEFAGRFFKPMMTQG